MLQMQRMRNSDVIIAVTSCCSRLYTHWRLTDQQHYTTSRTLITHSGLHCEPEKHYGASLIAIRVVLKFRPTERHVWNLYLYRDHNCMTIIQEHNVALWHWSRLLFLSTCSFHCASVSPSISRVDVGGMWFHLKTSPSVKFSVTVRHSSRKRTKRGKKRKKSRLFGLWKKRKNVKKRRSKITVTTLNQFYCLSHNSKAIIF